MSSMNDDGPDQDNWQTDDSDIGPEPSWLTDSSETTSEFTATAPSSVTVVPRVEAEPVTQSPLAREHAWLWGLLPLVFLGVLALVAWFSTTQSLNNTSVWDELHRGRVALLPARWTMLMWWIIAPVVAIYLIWSLTPTGRAATHIKRTSPLLIGSFASTTLWVISQIWHWTATGLVSIAIATGLMAICYLTALLEKTAIGWKRWLATSALGAAMGYLTMLLVLTWEQNWQQPLGVRGTAVVIVFALVLIAALVSLVFKEPILPLVLTVWLLGTAQQQWSVDKALSLTAIVALVFTSIVTGLGVLLAAEQKRPLPGQDSPSSRGRTRFFRKTPDSPA